MSETGYHGQFPPGLPPGLPLPRPKRPQVMSVLLVAGLCVLFAGTGLLSLLAITSETGVLGLVSGALLAAIPVFPVAATFLWLDRYESEPTSMLALAFFWGAAVATFGALVINTASMQAIDAAGGDIEATAVFVAPVVEETLKGAAIVLIVLIRRREFDGVVDGLVYAGMAAVGFAYVENVLYLGRTLAEDGSGGTIAVFILRCIVSPFAHPLFTAAIGIGIGLAVRTRNPALRVIAPVAGWLVAVFLHGLWNSSAASGLAGFLSTYVVLQMPVFLGFIVLAILARRREGQLIARHLTIYGTTGWLTQREVGMLASLPQRREARTWAKRVGGADAGRAMRDFQELASELAFIRERMTRGTAPPDAPTTELATLTAMAQLRSHFLPASR
jgi:RsiW-degrading membrane proteinase PrsW (M82 family)